MASLCFESLNQKLLWTRRSRPPFVTTVAIARAISDRVTQFGSDHDCAKQSLFACKAVAEGPSDGLEVFVDTGTLPLPGCALQCSTGGS